MILKTCRKNNKEILLKLVFFVSLCSMLLTAFLVFAHLNEYLYNYMIFIKALCFATWCILWVIWSNIFVFSLDKKSLFWFVSVSTFSGIITLLSTLLLNSYCYFMVSNFTDNVVSFSNVLLREILNIKIYHGALIVGFFSTILTLILFDKYNVLYGRIQKNDNDKRVVDKANIDVYQTLSYLGNALSNADSNTPYIIAVENSEQKINVILTGKCEETEDLLKYILISTAKIRQNNGADFSEILDDLNALTLKAVSQSLDVDEEN